MKKIKVVLFSLTALLVASVPPANALAACSYNCNSSYYNECAGYSYSVNIQHGYKNSTGQVAYHGYSVVMGKSAAKCIHNNIIGYTGDHTHTYTGHIPEICGVSNSNYCTY